MTDKRMTANLRALAEPTRQLPPLPAAVNAPPVRAVRGMATTPQATGGGAGTGIACPLVEQDAGTRTYWPDGHTSSDGLFILPAIKTLSMVDADNLTVLFEYANPHADNGEDDD
jgi:hypothetical protein